MRPPVESVACRECGAQVKLDEVCCGYRYFMHGHRVCRVRVEFPAWTWAEWLAVACGVVILAAAGWLFAVLGCAL